MGRFKKKPVIIEAFQVKDCDDTDMPQWLSEAFDDGTIIGGHNDDFSVFAKINTLEGVMLASEGDWIIKGINGELYPCKPDIFEKTYEAVLDLNEPKYIDFNSFVDKYNGALEYTRLPSNNPIVSTPKCNTTSEEPFYRTNAIGFDPSKETSNRGLL